MRPWLKKTLILPAALLVHLVFLVMTALFLVYHDRNLTRELVEQVFFLQTGFAMEAAGLDYRLSPFELELKNARFSRIRPEEEFEVAVERATVKGKEGIKRLVKGEKPLVEFVRLQGVVLCWNLREEEPFDIWVDFRHQLEQFSEFLGLAGEFLIEDSFVAFRSPRFDLEISGMNIRLAPSLSGDACDFFMEWRNGRAHSLKQGISLETSARSSGILALSEEKPILEGRFHLEPEIRLSPDEAFSPGGMNLVLRAKLDFPEKIISLSLVEAAVHHLVRVEGFLNAGFKEDAELRGEARISFGDLGWAVDFLKPYLPAGMDILEATGSASLEGCFQSEGGSLRNGTKVKGRLEIAPSRVSFLRPDLAVSSVFAGAAAFEGFFPDLEFEGSVAVQEGELALPDFKLRQISTEILFKKKGPMLSVSPVRGKIGNLTGSRHGMNVDRAGITFDAGGGYDLEKRVLAVRSLELRVPPFPPFHFKADLGLRPAGKSVLHFRTAGISITDMFAQARSFLPENIDRWNPRGFLDVAVVTSGKNGGSEWDFGLELKLARGMFHDPSFTMAGESLEARAAVKGRYSPLSQISPFDLEFELDGGESLFKEVYVDWGENPVRGKLAGLFHRDSLKIEGLASDLSLFPLENIRAAGEIKIVPPTVLELDISTSPLKMASLLDFISRHLMPVPEGFRLEGEAGIKARLSGDGSRLSAVGHIWLREGRLDSGETGFVLEGIEAGIPFYYERIPGDDREKREDAFSERGHVRVENIRTPYFAVDGFHLDLESRRNFFFFEPFTLDILGGRAEFGRSALDIGSEEDGFKGTFSFSLKGGDVSRLPVNSEMFPLEGKFRTDLFQVELTPRMMTSRGEWVMDVFDGRVNVRNIRVSRPFFKGRAVSCDVSFEDLNLQKLTDSIPFGRVTGVIKGELKGLTISYGQPQGFILCLKSEKRKGVPRKFSLKAVNDLAVIGSGEKTVLSSTGLFTRFISDFPYEKIGICCALENDIFTLRGIITERGVEYLVKRSWLFGINVINRKSPNQINFKDMMSRLKRIGQTGQ